MLGDANQTSFARAHRHGWCCNTTKIQKGVWIWILISLSPFYVYSEHVFLGVKQLWRCLLAKLGQGPRGTLLAPLSPHGAPLLLEAWCSCCQLQQGRKWHLSKKRCHVGLCAWATEMVRYNFSNHCECDPDCHCLGMCLRLSFHGPE